MLNNRRAAIGLVTMGLLLPTTLWFLLGLSNWTQWLTLASATFLTWGVTDLTIRILETPRLENRSARAALQKEWRERQD